MNLPVITDILQRHGYEVIKTLGSKLIPSCLQVYNSSFNDFYVCKIIMKKANYEKELHALSILDHPNIVRLYAHFEENDTYFLILEYCEGGNLETLIKSKSRPKQDKILVYTKQIVTALTYMHSKKIVHHDLKPSKILFDRYGRIKVAGFGLSVQYETKTSKYYIGSYGYLSPEQRANQEFDPFVADIWTFGVTLYFMTCGFNPFFLQKTDYKFLLPMFVDKTIASIINGALEVDPTKRISLEQIHVILTSNSRYTPPSNSCSNLPVTQNLATYSQLPPLKRRKGRISTF